MEAGQWDMVAEKYDISACDSGRRGATIDGPEFAEGASESVQRSDLIRFRAAQTPAFRPGLAAPVFNAICPILTPG